MKRKHSEKNKERDLDKVEADVVLEKQKMKFPAKLISNRELAIMLQMKKTEKTIKKSINLRVLLCGIYGILGFLLGMALKKGVMPIFLASLIFPVIIWVYFSKKTFSDYETFMIERQITFFEFIRLSATKLMELKKGINLFNILREIRPMLKNDNDKKVLGKLMIDMSNKKKDPAPFLEFAHEFSVSDRAELYMLTIHEMYIGSADDEALRSLAKDINEELEKQINKVIRIKVQRLSKIAFLVGTTFLIPVLGYVGLNAINAFLKIAQMMR